MCTALDTVQYSMNFDIIDDAGNRINILCDFLFSEKKKTKIRYKLLGAITENGSYVTPYQYKNAKWRTYSDSFHSAYSITVKLDCNIFILYVTVLSDSLNFYLSKILYQRSVSLYCLSSLRCGRKSCFTILNPASVNIL